MARISRLLSILTFTLFSIATAHLDPRQCNDSGHAPAPVEPIVSSTCSPTKYPDTCVSTVQSHAHSAPHATAKSVSTALSHSTIDLTTTTRDDASKAAGGLVGTVAKAANERKMNYDEALRKLVEAQAAFEKNDKAGASCGFKAAIEGFSFCQREFIEMPGFGQFAEQDELLQKMTDNCISALDLF